MRRRGEERFKMGMKTGAQTGLASGNSLPRAAVPELALVNLGLNQVTNFYSEK